MEFDYYDFLQEALDIDMRASCKWKALEDAVAKSETLRADWLRFLTIARLADDGAMDRAGVFSSPDA